MIDLVLYYIVVATGGAGPLLGPADSGDSTQLASVRQLVEKNKRLTNLIKLHKLPNGGWFPVAGVRSVFARDEIVSEHFTVDVNSISIDRKDIPDSLFMIKFHEDAEVYNAITGTYTEGGLTWDRRQRNATPRESISLVRKKLAEVDGLVALIPADANDRPILILFFDQQQRPSRRAALDMSGRTDQLKAKGVAVVALQVTKLDQTNLDKWLADQKVAFKVRILEEDFEAKKAPWGIKALPWLILADKGHKVVAEGIAVGQFDDLVRTIGDKL